MPTLKLVWPVYVLFPAVVVPSFAVVLIENRHGPPGPLTQFPPGAPTVTSGPKLL